ncbi:MAG: hypothetical protein ACRD29_07345, partial [Acidimicrobiales bacterium]
RWPMAAGAAAAGVAVAVGVVTALLAHRDSPAGERVELDGLTQSTATAQLEPRDWGTEIRLEVRDLEAGIVYHLWLRTPHGSRVSAGSFTAIRGEAIELVTASALPADKAAGVGISAMSETVLYGHLDDRPDR